MSIIQAIVWAVGVHVGGRDVDLGADDGCDLGGIAAGEALKLVHAQLLGVYDHSALGSAIRNAHHGAFPRHPHGEGLHLVQRHVLVVANASLGRAPGERVLHPVACEDFIGAVVHAHREVHRQLALGLRENLLHPFVQVELVGCQHELLDRHFIWVGLCVNCLYCVH